MSGSVSGVQARVREKHPEAVYIHCYAHELNLVLCHTCRAVPEASDLFDTLESVYCFFSVSIVNHQKFSDVQMLLGLKKSELVQLSKTRWACQVKSVRAMLDNLQAVLKCLEESATPLADSVDLAQATLFKDAVLETLKSMRTDEMVEKLYNEAKAICDANNISERQTGRRHKQRRMEDFTVESTLGTRAHLGTEDQLKHSLFYPCLDRMVTELDSRFSDVGAELMKGIQACNPAADDFLSEDSLDLIATHYKMSVRKEEILVAKQFLTSRKREGAVSDMGSVYKLLQPEMFPTLSSVVQAALTIPVSSCTCERSFSVLRRLHTWLRRTMGQDRLHHLAIMAVEKEALCGLDHGDVIDRFAQVKPRRYPLMLKGPKK
ncbi:hypothetical protein NHX12_032687 [Muraenolepis orangiensis]|uniref:HAT C-terminal dimerisation domain-containing protein n=1 Tax=Muraenolepis orangiensis TaxID=630683 RepID=A0A9Q0I1K1_9TELE|nr:hypothetical protein NHX12_017225 [Muraenolepis orangiensis]KAJ3582070.1 hypothetical protein NHX12_015913 [Muraenolepis orangiensis]KAJ3582914.1 hypothetical protein NHX12_000112 [Muraenolepis orangiensis]KAJ3583089.1 hypothetical protein NHX12_034480 [Muraenolepis orangiensis]KAJ3588914.1 hypothetical protein NHX12_009768 [Muraenolepis orangiensis]